MGVIIAKTMLQFPRTLRNGLQDAFDYRSTSSTGVDNQLIRMVTMCKGRHQNLPGLSSAIFPSCDKSNTESSLHYRCTELAPFLSYLFLKLIRSIIDFAQSRLYSFRAAFGSQHPHTNMLAAMSLSCYMSRHVAFCRICTS